MNASYYLIASVLITYVVAFPKNQEDFAAGLCKDSSTDVYINECMNHCTSKHDANSCGKLLGLLNIFVLSISLISTFLGLCANHGTLKSPIIKKRCICFKGLTCALAVPTSYTRRG